MDGTGPAFETILDARIAAHVAEASRAVPAVDERPDPGVRFVLSGAAGAAWVFARPRGPAPSAVPPAHAGAHAPATPAPPATRPARRLSAAEREAARRLRQWGADLPEDFTDLELKRAYRQLARQFHPDQHPAASAATRAALGGAFHQIHLMYRLLAGESPRA